MKPLAIYIHIPFCKRKCAYCDFASFAGCEHLYQQYFDVLGGEIDAWQDKLRNYTLRSIFFGGGTPSLVPAEYIAAAIGRIARYIEITPETEITIEANPGTVDMEKLRVYRRAGINRISFGVQSFDAALLKALGRIHDPEEAKQAVFMAKEAGFERISIDLMYALPGQTMRTWQETIETALQLPVDHISAYSLIVEEDTQMGKWVSEGSVSLPDEDTVNEMQRMAVAKFEKAGLMRYEISNFAKPGSESRHNMAYWQDVDYLGLGCAAHSLMENERFSNPNDLEAYLSGVRMQDLTVRSEMDRREEIIMLSTRMTTGLDMRKWKADFAEDFETIYRKPIEKMQNYGLIEIENGFMRLTPAGMELQDAVVLEFLDT